MAIGPIEGASGPDRIDRIRPAKTPPVSPTGPAAGADRVEISDEARLLSEIQAQPSVRAEKVEQLRREIESGKYENDERLKGALERFLADEI